MPKHDSQPFSCQAPRLVDRAAKFKYPSCSCLQVTTFLTARSHLQITGGYVNTEQTAPLPTQPIKLSVRSTTRNVRNNKRKDLLLLLPLALQPTVGFGLSNNILPFSPICHQLSPSSHSQHLKISFYFLFPSFPGSSPSSRPFQFLSEDLFGHPILLYSL